MFFATEKILMKTIDLKKIEHNVKIGDNSKELEPTLFQDSLFLVDGDPIGFYLAKLPDKLEKLVNISNFELTSVVMLPKVVSTLFRAPELL